MSIPAFYTLPNSPTYACLDRFSILDEGHENADGHVPVWPLITKILEQPVAHTSHLIDILETISNTLRETSGVAGDYGTLKAFLDEHPSFCGNVWPRIRDAALRLPTHFPEASIPVLRPGDEVVLERDQAACLVAHQFLCTLREPPWRDGYFDFSIWYASGQRHRQAVEIYLTSFLTLFSELAPSCSVNSRPDQQVRYSLHSFKDIESSLPLNRGAAPLSPMHVFRLEDFTTRQQELEYQGPGGAVVVSANKHIGFGQSATQEEIYVGNCPEACPAVLFTPPLEDDHALTVQGARPMLRITGQRRDIAWEPLPIEARRGGRMLFMDALELDELFTSEGEGRLPDLRPENMDREIHKAVTAFSAWKGEGHRQVSIALWGCGAFNGNPAVKMMLVWVAASMTNVSIEVMCHISTQSGFADKFEPFMRGLSGGKVEDLMAVLDSLSTDDPLLQV
ncbi:uncharacterized protein DNG_07324 [Cephalotrichum gorgonifer]|uniref:poly(ADP-ribose) glycohydrolase n=1 Tax=Cephalotrichum gorgonifer TaxID=2041049 RepID=A0AAE8N347_9PEZI|nr:uncharacterized protein DNG_07324 [Cephalotrichum gorgonifer]